jgi:hypothetical protein
MMKALMVLLLLLPMMIVKRRMKVVGANVEK